MTNNREENNLDHFFAMIDSVEDDISEMLEMEGNQCGRYECLIICFNSLKLYCSQVGIEFSQINDHYVASNESEMEGACENFEIGSKSINVNEVQDFIRLLEEIESSLTTFEKRCKKTEELFDEWNCVFILYSCLRKYCDKTNTNYLGLMNDILKAQSDYQNNEDS